MADVTREVLLEDRGFLEGPRWHGGELWLSDLHRHEVLVLGADGTCRVMATLDDQPSGLGFLPDGSAIVVSLLDRVVRRVDDLTVHSDLTALTVGGTNDMIVDDQGRAYVGSFGYDVFGGEARQPANLVLVEPDGSARVVADDMGFPNGMAFTSKGTLLVAESSARRITEFDVADDGSLSGRRVWCELPGRPDGLTIDAEDVVWVGLAHDGRYVHVHEGGAIDAEHAARAGWHAVACQLGGPDGRTLFLLMADVRDRPAVAALEAVTVDVPAP